VRQIFRFCSGLYGDVLHRVEFLATTDIDTARDFVYVHSNLRQLENIQVVNYYVETTVEWEQWAVADSYSE